MYQKTQYLKQQTIAQVGIFSMFTYGSLYQLSMDSQAQSTNCTSINIQRPMQYLRLWARSQVNQGQPGRVVDLLAFIPIMKELQGLQLLQQVFDMSPDDHLYIMRILGLQDSSPQAMRQEIHFSRLKISMEKQAEKFQRQLLHSCRSEHQTLQDAISTLNLSVKEHSKLFADFLQSTRASKVQMDAFDVLIGHFEKSLRRYIFAEDRALKSFTKVLKENDDPFRPSLLEERQKSKKKQKRKSLELAIDELHEKLNTYTSPQKLQMKKKANPNKKN